MISEIVPQPRENQMPTSLILLLGSLATASTLELIFALGPVRRLWKLAQHGIRTEGTIIGSYSVVSRGCVQRLPIVQFRDAHGRLHEFKSRFPRTPSFNRFLNAVTVVYDHAQSQPNAEILERRYWVPRVVSSFAFLATAIALV